MSDMIVTTLPPLPVVKTTLVTPPPITTTIVIGQGPAGVGLSPGVYVALEALTAGNMVTITATGVRKASRANYSKQCHGYAALSVLMGAPVTVHFAGVNSALSGLTVGPLWLGLDGSVTSTPLSVGPGAVQLVGFASAVNSMIFQPGLPVVLAGTPA